MFVVISLFLAAITPWVLLLVLYRAIGPLIHEIYLFYVAPKLNRGSDPAKEFGAWAAITGATDGIGKGYAFNLAKKGMNILLISRNEQKLAAVKQELLEYAKKQLSGSLTIEVETLTHDFSKAATSEDVATFRKRFESYENKGGLGVLVNNVGILPHVLTTFQTEYLDAEGVKDSAMEQLNDYCRVNCLSVIQMTLAALPVMRRQRRGAIVNISSVAALSPQNGYSIYGSTKCFVHNFSRALRQDLLTDQDTRGIHVQTVAPGCVDTNILPDILRAKSAAGKFFVPDYPTFTAHAVETIGRTVETNGCIGHRLLAYAIVFGRLLPPTVSDKLITRRATKMREEMEAHASSREESKKSQ